MGTARHALMTTDRAANSEATAPAAAPGSRHVFISYSRKDSAAARALVGILERSGLTFWIDQEDIKGGENFSASVDAAIASAGAVLVLWSEHSAASDFV